MAFAVAQPNEGVQNTRMLEEITDRKRHLKPVMVRDQEACECRTVTLWLKRIRIVENEPEIAKIRTWAVIGAFVDAVYPSEKKQEQIFSEDIQVR